MQMQNKLQNFHKYRKTRKNRRETPANSAKNLDREAPVML